MKEMTDFETIHKRELTIKEIAEYELNVIFKGNVELYNKAKALCEIMCD